MVEGQFGAFQLHQKFGGALWRPIGGAPHLQQLAMSPQHAGDSIDRLRGAKWPLSLDALQAFGGETREKMVEDASCKINKNNNKNKKYNKKLRLSCKFAVQCTMYLRRPNGTIWAYSYESR